MRQIIYLGATANDGTGDTLRSGGTKLNSNFAELYNRLGGDSINLSASIKLTDSGLEFTSTYPPYNTISFGFAEPTANRTIVVPDGSYTLVGTNTVQTLTNKTIRNASFSNFSIRDLDSSHTYNFVPANISANRNINIPLLTDSDTLILANAAGTLSNKTINSPIITTPRIRTHIADSTGAEIIRLPSVNNAVNEVTVTNAVAGQGPTISATGNDVNIRLNINSKGSGGVRVNNVVMNGSNVGADSSGAALTLNSRLAYGAEVVTSSGNINLAIPLTIFNAAAGINMTMADATVIGETKKFANIGVGTATITPTSFAQGVSFRVATGGVVEVIYIGTSVATGDWYLLADSSNKVTIQV